MQWPIKDSCLQKQCVYDESDWMISCVVVMLIEIHTQLLAKPYSIYC